MLRPSPPHFFFFGLGVVCVSSIVLTYVFTLPLAILSAIESRACTSLRWLTRRRPAALSLTVTAT